jgi:two-component system sensor kinase FixL
VTFVSVLACLTAMGLGAASLLVFVAITPAVLTWYVMSRRLHALCARVARTRAGLKRIKAQLRARTERHKLTLRAINDVIFYWNVRANVLRWSANGRRCRGWELRSCRPWPLLTRSLDERDRDRVLQDLHAFMQRNESVWRSEFTVKGCDGVPIPISVRGILERDAAGKPWRMIGAITDMTDARAAKESARALARAARLAAIGEITASITHQVNQPLAAILNNAETGLLLSRRKQESPGMLREILEDIRSDALRASEIVRRTRALLQDREMVRERVSVNKLVTDAVDLLWLQARRRGVALSATPGGVPMIHGDPVHLQQVVINLIANALDATEPGVDTARRVEVSTAHHSGKVTVRVADTGCGIAPTQLEAIFESFNTGKADGLGIGLSIARSIVSAHGGRIFAENNRFGPGATVSFELPIAVDSSTHSRSPEAQLDEQ